MEDCVNGDSVLTDKFMSLHKFRLACSFALKKDLLLSLSQITAICFTHTQTHFVVQAGTTFLKVHPH